MSRTRNDEENHEETAEDNQPVSRRWVAELWDWVKSISLAVGIVLIVHHFVFNLSTVQGHSMEPTLEDKEWLFVNRAIYYLDRPQYEDVVILSDPRQPEKKSTFLVKRIVGLPGDTIMITDGQLYRNGQAIDESYIDVDIEDGDFGPIKVEDDHYFVMGDNRHRQKSTDSRRFGPVSDTHIKGRADLILWPPTKMTVIK